MAIGRQFTQFHVDVTCILSQIEERDPQAAKKLLPLVDDELRIAVHKQPSHCRIPREIGKVGGLKLSANSEAPSHYHQRADLVSDPALLVSTDTLAGLLTQRTLPALVAEPATSSVAFTTEWRVVSQQR